MDTMTDTIYGAIITTGGDLTWLTEPVEYATMRAAVGGCIAPVNCPHGDTVYVHDEGLCIGLEPNLAAMLVAQYPGPLVGDAIVCGPDDGEGDHLPLSAPVVQFIRRILG